MRALARGCVHGTSARLKPTTRNFRPSDKHWDWNRYRKDGDLYGKTPTNAEYGEAAQQALQASGFSPRDASYLAGRAASQRAEYGLLESDPVPRIPRAINQGRSSAERLRDRLREAGEVPSNSQAAADK
jgi:hypothetical protein